MTVITEQEAPSGLVFPNQIVQFFTLPEEGFPNQIVGKALVSVGVLRINSLDWPFRVLVGNHPSYVEHKKPGTYSLEKLYVEGRNPKFSGNDSPAIQELGKRLKIRLYLGQDSYEAEPEEFALRRHADIRFSDKFMGPLTFLSESASSDYIYRQPNLFLKPDHLVLAELVSGEFFFSS